MVTCVILSQKYDNIQFLKAVNHMQQLGFNEIKQRGTSDFPVEFHHVNKTHPQYQMPYHWHVDCEMIRILSGNFHISLDEKEYELSKGDTVFINSGVLHGGSPDECVYECLVFDMSMLSKGNEICKNLISKLMSGYLVIVENLGNEKSGECAPLIDKMFDTVISRYNGYQLVFQGLLYQLLGNSISSNTQNSVYFPVNRIRKKITSLKKVIELIETSYSGQITLEDMSAAAGMSRKYFCSFFKEMTHKSPVQYLNYCRVEHASRLLVNTDDSVTEIAFACGFNDLSYFIKTFRKYKGESPYRFAKRNKTKPPQIQG